jgi:hypothetical protein
LRRGVGVFYCPATENILFDFVLCSLWLGQFLHFPAPLVSRTLSDSDNPADFYCCWRQALCLKIIESAAADLFSCTKFGDSKAFVAHVATPSNCVEARTYEKLAEYEIDLVAPELRYL